jgi:hypothetical protein
VPEASVREDVDGCVSGATCHPDGDVCETGTISCTSGAAACVDVTRAASGIVCGTGRVCSDGKCVNCVPGAACDPGGNACQTGVLSCSTGSSTCDRVGNASNGTVCGANNVCVDGACVPCTDGAACVFPGNPCQTGRISCGSGEATCVAVDGVSDGVPCEAGICCGGLCAACSPPANAVGACTGTTCGYACNAGFTLCAGTCVDATTDSQACGPSCAVCPVGSPCNNAQCTPVFSYGDSAPYSPCVDADFEMHGLLGERLYIGDDIEVTALGVIASAAEPASGVHGIMALYGDTGGMPTGLMANTPSTTIGPGENVIPVVSTTSAPAGYYWIMAEYDGPASVCGDNATGNAIFYVQAGYQNVPVTITDATPAVGPDINYYVLGALSTQ